MSQIECWCTVDELSHKVYVFPDCKTAVLLFYKLLKSALNSYAIPDDQIDEIMEKHMNDWCFTFNNAHGRQIYVMRTRPGIEKEI